jgi:hypothetical protein
MQDSMSAACRKDSMRSLPLLAGSEAMVSSFFAVLQDSNPVTEELSQQLAEANTQMATYRYA